jgi:hypothetical protein
MESTCVTRRGFTRRPQQTFGIQQPAGAQVAHRGRQHLFAVARACHLDTPENLQSQDR